MTSASLRYPKPKVDRARNGEEEGKGREGDSFSPGCPLSSHRRHLLFDPSQSRRRKRPRAKRGRFIWMRDASVAAFSFSLSFWHLASESRCMDHPDASSVDCSSYECSSAKKKFDPFLKRVWIFFFFFACAWKNAANLKGNWKIRQEWEVEVRGGLEYSGWIYNRSRMKIGRELSQILIARRHLVVLKSR